MATFAFIIIATELQPWKRIMQDGPEATWLKALQNGERYLAAYSDGTLNKSIQDPQDHQKIIFQGGDLQNWQLSQPRFMRSNHASFEAHDGFGGLVPTTISAISYLQESFDPDFFIRTNVSSYWNLHNLRRLLSQLSRNDIYAGVTGSAYSGLSGKFRSARYVSGAGMVLSRDIASKLIEIRNSIDLKYIDDLTIGRSLTRAGVKPTELKRIDVNSVEDVVRLDQQIFQENFHFRCKSEQRRRTSSFRNDVLLMKAIDERVNQNARK